MSDEQPAEAQIKPLRDKPLESFQLKLLGLASQSAAAVPMQPHVKTRSRLQEAVGETQLRLGLLHSASTQFAAVENWRSGTGFADLAFECAADGQVEQAMRLLALAEVALSETTKDQAQDWRGDRVRARMSRALFALNMKEQARVMAGEVESSELGPALQERARGFTREEGIAYLAEAEQIAKAGVFDQVQACLKICADLYGRFYADVELRTSLEERIRSAWNVMPVSIRVETIVSMSKGALEAGDQPSSRTLLDDAEGLLSKYEWKQIQDYLPLLAKVATQRAMVGNEVQAQELIGLALAAYEKDAFRTADIYHARSLRPLAESLAKMGDEKGALVVYARVLKAGMSNPNSVPRTVDFVATCCSMAELAVEPNQELWDSLLKISKGFSAPW